MSLNTIKRGEVGSNPASSLDIYQTEWRHLIRGTGMKHTTEEMKKIYQLFFQLTCEDLARLAKQFSSSSTHEMEQISKSQNTATILEL